MLTSSIFPAPAPDGTTLPLPVTRPCGTETSPLAFLALLTGPARGSARDEGATEEVAGLALGDDASPAKATGAAAPLGPAQATPLFAEAGDAVLGGAEPSRVETEQPAPPGRSQAAASANFISAKGGAADAKAAAPESGQAAPVASTNAEGSTSAPIPPQPVTTAGSETGGPSVGTGFAAGSATIAAPPTATPSPAAMDGAGTVAPDPPAQQIVRAVAVSPHDRAVEVRLDPPSLGRVTVEFDFSNDQVKAVIHAQEAETLSLLRRGVGTLTKQLEAQGFVGVSIEFAEGGRGENLQERASPHATVRRVAMSVPVASDTPPLPAPAHRGEGLDLRL
ncbi:flagellar hook-length control protein FliK [Parvularcula dongshanensis]|uniref:Flagellar hook-length control protein-like C-terminal domain-containing protein n=1 Tax=Parvularcula dongshanensis TaxID=1173995 RepID=A0A840I824_9PROT|nr:flagellar hook-length control protein FliK [Parvularcula dongshanensis]MBB4660314.1 hypothetical protein [Parvularcula dongshanensis]